MTEEGLLGAFLATAFWLVLSVPFGLATYDRGYHNAVEKCRREASVARVGRYVLDKDRGPVWRFGGGDDDAR